MSITQEQVITTLREVVAEYGGDYIYTQPVDKDSCVYVYRGAPSCLVAHVLTRHDVSLAFLSKHEGQDPPSFSGLIDLDGSAAHALGLAQEAQDAGRTWGEALACAEPS